MVNPTLENANDILKSEKGVSLTIPLGMKSYGSPYIEFIFQYLLGQINNTLE